MAFSFQRLGHTVALNKPLPEVLHTPLSSISSCAALSYTHTYFHKQLLTLCILAQVKLLALFSPLANLANKMPAVRHWR